MDQEKPTALARLAPLAVRLAALWVLAVTSIKLFKGSPNDIPPFIRDHFFGPQINFNLSIGIELACAFAALAYPRRMFAPLALLMTFFVGVLLYLISQGATSCGCFGGAIKFPPWAMLCVDGSLLAFMLATRPWKIRPSQAPVAVLAITTVVAFAAPWVLIRTAQFKPPEPSANGQVEWHMFEKPWPRFVEWPTPKWIGKSIHETELAPWVDTHSLPADDNRWVIYSHSCDHCRDYLRRLYNETPVAPELVLIELTDDKPRSVDLVPDTPWKVVLPPEVQFVVPQSPPWELVIRGDVVQEAHYRGEE